MRKTERIADRHHPIAHFGSTRIAQWQRGQAGFFHLQHRDVSLFVSTNNRRAKFTPIVERNLNVRRFFDDVVVRQHVPVRVVHERRPQSFLNRSSPS